MSMEFCGDVENMKHQRLTELDFRFGAFEACTNYVTGYKLSCLESRPYQRIPAGVILWPSVIHGGDNVMKRSAVRVTVSRTPGMIIYDVQ